MYILMPRHWLPSNHVNWKEMRQVIDFNVNLESQLGKEYVLLNCMCVEENELEILINGTF